ncbi:MAG TPA: hypothetical protein VN729_07690 [Ktedonobacteraceae bacterium]|nr:hypothetical protein [Ktedonobacteraceae bacterium]
MLVEEQKQNDEAEMVRRGMGVAHTSPHQKENERAAGATFQWP